MLFPAIRLLIHVSHVDHTLVVKAIWKSNPQALISFLKCIVQGYSDTISDFELAVHAKWLSPSPTISKDFKGIEIFQFCFYCHGHGTEYYKIIRGVKFIRFMFNDWAFRFSGREYRCEKKIFFT